MFVPRGGGVAAGFRSLADQRTEILFLYSEGDPGIEELDLILEGDLPVLASREPVQYGVVEKGDHMFPWLASHEEFLHLTGTGCRKMRRGARTGKAMITTASKMNL